MMGEGTGCALAFRYQELPFHDFYLIDIHQFHDVVWENAFLT